MLIVCYCNIVSPVSGYAGSIDYNNILLCDVVFFDYNELGLWLRLECSLDCIIYVSEGFDVPRDYRSRRGRETIKRYDVTETYSHVVRQNLSETSITCAESG